MTDLERWASLPLTWLDRLAWDLASYENLDLRAAQEALVSAIENRGAEGLALYERLCNAAGDVARTFAAVESR